jgi:DNA invertase Pin-like site-specific DNA recombinase
MLTKQATQIMAGYVRLSKEDEEKQVESESVQNQKALLTSYAGERGWKLHDIYTDEDYSGVDSKRPEFNRLLADAEKGKFNIVVCKSQSRFTRDMEAVEKYIHNKFLLWGIRFISITDNADTSIKGNKKARQINGLINEWYLEDLSENVRTVLDHKRVQGQYIGSFPLYGYVKSPDNHNLLVIDPVAAEVVRKIYDLYMQGRGKTQIAMWLNERGIPSPAAHKRELYPSYHNPNVNAASNAWNPTSISRILKERTYTGDLVQGKAKKVSYKSDKMVHVPEKDWIVVPNTHEAIIDKATFITVRDIRDQRVRGNYRGIGTAHALSGKVRCMDCGSSMNKYQMTYKDAIKFYLRCKLYSIDMSKCSGHSIRLDRLEHEILCRLSEHIRHYHETKQTSEYLRDDRCQQRRGAIQKEITALHSKMERARQAKREIYTDKAAGILTTEEFIDFSAGYTREIEQCEARLSTLEADLTGLEAQKLDFDAIQRKIAGLTEFESLTRELVLDFIDYVEIGEKDPMAKEQEIRIHWLF